MTDQEKQNSVEQKEEIEIISGIPFSTGPFKTKEGMARPSLDNLYLNKTMRRFLLGDENIENGTVEIDGKILKIRQARRSVEDGRLRNMVNPKNIADVKRLLDEKMNLDPEIAKQTGVTFHCGEFKTKKGLRSPEGRTIYATKALRKLLGIEDVTGTVVINNVAYKVKQARRPGEGDEFANIVHPVEENTVQQFLLGNIKETRQEIGNRVSEVLDKE